AHAETQRRFGFETREHYLAVPTDRPAPQAPRELELREAGALHVAPRRQELRGMESWTFALVAGEALERPEVAPRLEAQAVRRAHAALAIDEQETFLAREAHARSTARDEQVLLLAQVFALEHARVQRIVRQQEPRHRGGQRYRFFERRREAARDAVLHRAGPEIGVRLPVERHQVRLRASGAFSRRDRAPLQQLEVDAAV